MTSQPGTGKSLTFLQCRSHGSTAVEITVDADVVEIFVAPRGCAVFFYLKNIFKINNRVPLQSGKILENRRKSRTLKTTTLSSVVQYIFIIFN